MISARLGGSLALPHGDFHASVLAQQEDENKVGRAILRVSLSQPRLLSQRARSARSTFAKFDFLGSDEKRRTRKLGQDYPHFSLMAGAAE